MATVRQLKNLITPVVGVDEDGNFFNDTNPAPVKVMGGGAIITEAYDYVAVTYPNSVTEIYTFKSGGAGGTTVGVVTVTYTDDTKESLLTVVRA
jgi:hypothetical protein